MAEDTIDVKLAVLGIELGHIKADQTAQGLQLSGLDARLAVIERIVLRICGAARLLAWLIGIFGTVITILLASYSDTLF